MISPMTIKEYAERIGRSYSLVYKWVRRGTLPPDVEIWRANNDDRMWIIPKQENENVRIVD